MIIMSSSYDGHYMTIHMWYLQRCHFYWGDHPLGGLTLHRGHPDHGWLIGWLFSWLVGWLVGWLVD